MKTMTNAFFVWDKELNTRVFFLFKIKSTPLDTYTYEKNVLMHINLLLLLLMINPSKNYGALYLVVVTPGL